eukprot:scaffold1350_cov249-Pinguiococcus_pyrenoidosus.AAC.24
MARRSCNCGLGVALASRQACQDAPDSGRSGSLGRLGLAMEKSRLPGRRERKARERGTQSAVRAGCVPPLGRGGSLPRRRSRAIELAGPGWKWRSLAISRDGRSWPWSPIKALGASGLELLWW